MHVSGFAYVCLFRTVALLTLLILVLNKKQLHEDWTQ
jgi:hypothetical protein